MTPIAGALTFLVVFLLGAVIYMPALREHYDTYGVRIRPRKKQELEAAAAPKDSLILSTAKTVGEAVLGIFPGLADKRTAELLVHGGYRTPAHIATYIGIKCLCVGGLSMFLLIGSAGNVMTLLLAVPMGLFSWILPNFFLAGRVKKRQKAVVSELPTIIDLMVVCAQAGLGLLMCIDKVQKECWDTCPNICQEFEQLLQDVKIFAKSVPVALKDMGERCGVEELTGVASSLIAADAKGSDISYPLKMQGEALRDRIKRKKEEEASKTPVKMVPVIMLFIMPLILCPMLGPAVITIMQAMGPVMSSTAK
jgi:tight adherence protein C